MAWYENGDPYDQSITEHASQWSKCIDEDGYIASNYGYYYDRLEEQVLCELRADMHTRRAVIPICHSDHLYVGAPDVPCTMYMGYLLRNGALHAQVHMRSQDAVWGLRNDIPAFQWFKLRLANKLNVPPGFLTVVVDSLHIYERHFEKVMRCITQDNNEPGFIGFTNLQDCKEWRG